MQNNIAFQPKGPIQNSNPAANDVRVQSHSKAYTSSPANQKALGSSDSDLAAWMQEAQAYYNAVMNGSVERPAAAAWNEFLAQMDWASAQLGGASGGGWGEEEESVSSVNDFGGELGPDGNYNYDMVETNIGFTGDGTRNDVYGTDNTIDLDMPSAQVSCELTQDNGATVLKVVVTTSKGTAVYYYDNYDSPDFKLDIKIPDVNNVTGLAGLPAEVSGKIEVKKYTPSSQNNDGVRESNVEGTPIDGEENAYYYEGTVGETIEFTPQGSGVDGEITTHDVYGDSNISVKTSDTVNVTPAEAGADYDYLVTVTHKDGSVDVFRIRKAFDTNINAVEEFVSFDLDGDGVADTIDPGKVPDDLKSFLSLNRSEEAEDGEALHEGDTVPDSTEGDTASYNTSADVEIHADYDDDVTTHNISAPGTVVIHGADYSDTMQVQYDATSRTWTVTVFKGGDPTQVETFTVKGGPNTKVVLDVMGENSVQGAVESVQIGLNGSPTAQNSPTEKAQQLANIDGIELSYTEIQDAAASHGIDLKNPPGAPNTALFDFLVQIDPVLARLMAEYKTYDYDSSGRAALSPQIRDRLVVLLKAIYPNVNIGPGANGSWDGDDIVFGDREYDILGGGDKTDGHLQFTTSDT